MPLQRRTDCLLFNKGEIENEVHFRFYCPVYKDMRDVLYSKVISIYVYFFWLDEHESFKLCF